MRKIFLVPTLLFAGSAAAQTGIGTTNPTDQLHTTGTVRFEGYRGGATRLMQMDSSGRLSLTGGGPVFTNTANYPIPDDGCTTGSAATSSITVSGHPTPVQTAKISARVNINHAFDAQLAMFLVGPGGQVLCLAASVGLAGDNFTNTVFTDAATVAIGAGAAPFTGNYKPAGILIPGCLLTPTTATFSGISGGSINPNGTWTLKVFDGVAGTTGVLTDWSISFVSPEDFATAEQNNYVPKFSAGGLAISSIYNAPGSGNVGIGNSSPNHDLDVTGNVYASNKLIAGNTLVTDSLHAAGNVAIAGSLYLTLGAGAGKVLTDSAGTGVAVWQNLPSHRSAFHGTPAVATVIPSTIHTVIPYTTIGSNNFDDAGGWSNTYHHFTAPKAGIYHFDACVDLFGIAAATYAGSVAFILYKNGIREMDDRESALVGTYFNRTLRVSHTLKLSANDTVNFKVLQATQVGMDARIAGSSVSGFRVY